jgi:hypothetical protein
MRALTGLAIASALAACGGTDDGRSNQASPGLAEAGTNVMPTDAAPAGDVVTNDAAEETAIPAALHGRWGLVPEDCTSTRGDAKGLLVVAADELRFYESRARIGRVIESAPNRITADFDFTGEGMEWRRRMTLEAAADTLVRSETGEGAAPQPFRYSKCPG